MPARPEEERRAPERTRYGRKPVAERVADLRDELRAHPIAVFFGMLLLGGWIVLRLLTPAPLDFEELETGTCLYVRTGSASSIEAGDRPIGTPALVRASVVLGAAEPAPCDGSHGHEVAARTGFAASFGDAYPGEPDLLRAAQAPCEAAFLAHVGRPLEGSTLALTVVVPDERRWRLDIRDAVCLVHRADGRFLDASMLGSGL